MITENMLTLIINTLRDVAENKRMPSGIEVSEDVATLHEEAAMQMEHDRNVISSGQLHTKYREEDEGDGRDPFDRDFSKPYEP